MDHVYAIDNYDLIGDILSTTELPKSIQNSETKTEQQLKSNDMLLMLGNQFKEDNGINDGFPILTWQ